MKKKPNWGFFMPQRKIYKAILVMKLAILIVLFTTMNVSAFLYSQEDKISLDIQKKSLEEAFTEIENQTGFRFFFSDNYQDLDNVVSYTGKDVSIDSILTQLLIDKEVTFKILKNKIVVITPNSAISKQNIKVTGTVEDAKTNESLPSVNILIEGTSNGVVSDNSGKFEINVPATDVVLMVSSVGYVTERISLQGRTILDISLNPDIKQLDEVVVIGYGTQKKVNLTGSVAVVTSKNFEQEPVTDALQALQGKAAGVEVISNSGQPGAGNSVRIRGIQSWSAGTEPVYVIDGVISDNMNTINPNDIENISVLKDASSTAIYGARGANGVVLVTTKRGLRSAAPVITFHTYQGFQTESNLAKNFKMLNAAQYLKLMEESWTGVDGNPFLTFDADAAYAGIDTDWKELILRTGNQRYYDLSVAGGNDRATYYSSIGYLTNRGMIKGQGQERLTVRLNSDYKINKFIEFGNSLNLHCSKYNGWPDISGVGNDGINVSPDPYTRALEMTPVTRAYEADGSYGKKKDVNIEHKFVPPQAYINDCINDNADYGITGNVYIKLKILKGLSFTPRFSIDYNNFSNSQFIPKFIIDDGISENIDPNIVQKYNGSKFHWIADYMLNYENSFGGIHNVSAMLIYSQEESRNENLKSLRFNTLNNSLRYLDSASPDFMTNANGFTDWAFVSYVGRLNYNFAGKYLLEASVRRDGSSRFGQNNQWAVFPSGSIAWRISEEGFFKSVINVVNNLKVRASVGSVGFSGIAAYPSFSVLNTTVYTLNNALVSGYTSSIPSNADIKWESRINYDLGIDASFLNSRLNLTADLYRGRTTDMIIQTDIPSSAGKTENAFINGGEIENRGMEFELNFREKRGDFSYELIANLAASQNKVTNTNGQNRRTDGIEEGLPVFSMFGMKTHGIIKSDDVLNNYPHYPLAERGDIWKEDVNGDGIVNANDYTFIGKTYPDFTYGFSVTLGYKRVSLQCALSGVQGYDMYTQGLTLSYFESNPQNQDTRILDRWHPTENPNGNMPRITKVDPGKNIGEISDFWVDDASFLRINNINIRYIIPASIANKLLMKNLEIYGSVQNLYTFTGFSGPEVDVTPGDIFARIPQPRTWVLGLKVTF